MVADSTLYRTLQKHLDRMPVGYPPTQTGVELRILQHLFAPEEAEVALHLSMLGEPIERVHRRVAKYSLEDLQKILDRMEHRGTVMISDVKGKKAYGNAPLAIGMWEFQVERLTPELIEDMEEYSEAGFRKELVAGAVPQMRTVPVQKSLPLQDKYPVGDYDVIRKIVENTRARWPSPIVSVARPAILWESRALRPICGRPA
jgi:electron transport complex protein RnfB